MRNLIVLLALGLAAIGFCSGDPVAQALHYSGKTYPVTQRLPFDQFVFGAQARLLSPSATKYPAIAAELGRLSSLSPARVGDVERLWNYYLATEANKGSRAPYSRMLLDEDVRPDMADEWMYLLLKPSWSSAVNGPREVCLSALLRCDETRALRVLPELIDFLYDKDSGFPPQQTLLYSFFCAAYQYPDARGMATMASIQAAVAKYPEMMFASGNFEKTFTFFLNNLNGRNTDAWRQVLQNELKKPTLDVKLRRSIGTILGGGA